MKIFLKLILTLLLLSSSLWALSDKELAISINLAGKQRMLSQKMTKEAFLIYADIDKQENTQKLKKSSQLFDRTLKGLIKGDKSLELVAFLNDDIEKQLQKVEALWRPFYKEIGAIVTGKAKKSSYERLEKENEMLLKEMNLAVGLYSSQNSGSSKLALATDINLAGKQRMLTQKMAKSLIFVHNGTKKERYLSEFKNAQTLFKEILDGLFHGNKILNLTGTKLPKITKQLKIVEKLWSNHQPVLEKTIKGGDLKDAIVGLDTIMAEMNRGVFIYTQSVNRQKQRLQFASLLGSFMNKGNLLNKRVNLSGRQRMLTQRVTKLAILVASGIDKKGNSEKLIKFADLYSQTLIAFRDGDQKLGCVPANSQEIKNQIAQIEKVWNPFYEHLKSIAKGDDKDGKSLDYLVGHNEQLLKVSDVLVKKYEHSNKSKNYLDEARLGIIDMAGRQRMLTQKMTKEKLLIAKGEGSYRGKLEKTIKLFDDSLTALIAGDEAQKIGKPTNKKIEKQLQVVADIWKVLKPLYSKEKPTNKELLLIIKENPRLLGEMNQMVKMTEVSAEY